MKVCIAEKPSVAQSIASILGATQKRQGYYEGNGYQVTWTFGHLCELKNPEDYTPFWKPWAENRLPMIPQTFGITLKNDEGVQKQFQVIATLYANAECIINCGDAGQEGELIQRWVMQKAGIIYNRERNVYVRPDQTECPVYRLWINSMTDEAIRDGFSNLQPQQQYDKLYGAGLSRAIGDWLLGMNASRLYTLHYGHREQRQVLSIGRVQTPTLALIVKRHWEIVNFQPQQYFEIKTLYRDVTFNATKGRFENREEAEAALEQIKDKPLFITNVQKKQGKEKQPRLYDLTSLQVDCNRKFGFSADETLKYIQSLYEKKLTTYPRVDTTFLPDDIYPKCPTTLQGLRGYEALTAPLLQSGKKLPKSKQVFDNSKVTDHHAIIPTGIPANNIFEAERKVYDLVVRRFISVFYPECVFNTTTVNALAGDNQEDEKGLPFKVTGKVIVDPGWRAVYGTDNQSLSENNAAQNTEGKEDAKDEETAGILPDFQVGEYGPHEPSLLEKWTKAPPCYTEATLLRAMETAGKLCDDEELRDAMKENGLGRPSTRAAIIETLFRRHYIKKEKKNLVATQTGIELIGTIRQEILKSAELTGQWEKKLRQIERGEYEAKVFIDELKQMVCQIVDEVLHDNCRTQIAFTSEEDLNARKQRKKPEGDTVAAPKPKTPRKKTTPSAQVQPEPQYRYTRLTIPKVCPQCGVGQIVQGRTAFGCTNYANGCNFRIPFSDVKPE
ncbi:MAG: DNA topoisomerase 3 [Bacteroidales bacterium]|nr:DNA topoisomerase 3 [Candidatus Liminaster caballi]